MNNNNVDRSVIYMEPEELKNLLTEVKETVAQKDDIFNQNTKSNFFSAADLWNIQRKKRNVQTRRKNFWN